MVVLWTFFGAVSRLSWVSEYSMVSQQVKSLTEVVLVTAVLWMELQGLVTFYHCLPAYKWSSLEGKGWHSAFATIKSSLGRRSPSFPIVPNISLAGHRAVPYRRHLGHDKSHPWRQASNRNKENPWPCSTQIQGHPLILTEPMDFLPQKAHRERSPPHHT